MTNAQLRALYTAGVSIWLDDLSRSLIKNGQLAQLIDVDSVTGVTTNPSIFHAALSHLGPDDAYSAQIQELAKLGADVDTTIRTITTDDVRDACDIFAPVFEKTAGLDGRVSIEVDPRLANDTDQTIAQAISLWKIVDRPNLLIKIPATTAGIPAITRVIAEGISVNVTLIFSVQRYQDVINAYIQGLREAKRNGHDLTKIFSVASFFVSRVDTEIDKRLEKINTPQAHALKGKAGLANARLAYKLFQELFHSDVFGEFTGIANIQRPLWASTGVKNPEYPDTLYVGELVAPHTVNTMPEKTLRAFADHGVVHADSITAHYDEAAEVFAHLIEVGIDLEDVFTLLEQEGVDKFVQAWQELLTTTDEQLHKYKK